MATLTIRNLPDDVRDRLRIRAAQNGRSMEAEARALLSQVAGGKETVARRSAWNQAVREAQEAFAPYRNPTLSIVDELLAERRLEAWRETVEDHEGMNRNDAPGRVWLPDPRS